MLWLSKDIELWSSSHFFTKRRNSRREIMKWFGRRACTVKERDHIFFFGDKLYFNSQISNILSKSIPSGSDEFQVRECDLVPPHRDIISWSLNSEDDNEWYMAPEGALTHPHVLKCFVPIFNSQDDDIFASISFKLYSTIEHADSIFFSGLENLYQHHMPDYGKLCQLCFASPSQFQLEVVKSFVSKHSILHLVTYEIGQDHLKVEADSNVDKSHRLVVGVYPNRLLLLFPHNESVDDCDGLIRTGSIKTNSPIPFMESPRVNVLPEYAVERVVYGRRVIQCHEPLEILIDELSDLDGIVTHEVVSERLVRFGHVVLQLSREDLKDSVGGINYNLAMEFERQELYPLDENMDLYAVFGQSDKFQLRFTPAVEKSHQIPVVMNIITESRRGYRFLTQMRSDDTKQHFYLKGPPGWFIRKWKGHDIILMSEKNGFQNMRYSLPGINVPFVYVSPGVSFFAIHSEDGNLYSFNILLAGSANKYWWIIPRIFYERFVKWLNDYLKKKGVPNYCANVLQHKIIFVAPYDIPSEFEVSFVEQCPGQAIIVDASAVHWGFNAGPNLAYSFNFAGRDWQPTYHLQLHCNFMNYKLCPEIKFPFENSSKSNFPINVSLKDLLLAEGMVNKTVNNRAEEIMQRNYVSEMCQTPTDARSLLYYLSRFSSFKSCIEFSNLESRVYTNEELSQGKKYLPIRGADGEVTKKRKVSSSNSV